MNPNDIVSERWVNPTTGASVDSSNTDPTYGKLVTYKDGRRTLTVYKRGSGNPADGTPDDQVGDVRPMSPDENVKAEWDKAQKAGQTQADQAERKVVRTYTGTDPSTGRPAIVTEYESGAPKYEEIKPGARQVKSVTYDPRGGRSIKVTTYTDGSTSEEEAPPPAQGGGTLQVGGDGATYIVKPDGTTVKTTVPAKPNPGTSQTVKGEDGATYVVTVAPDGSITTQVAIPAPTAGPAVPSTAYGWDPDPSQLDLGMGSRQKQVAEMLAGGVFGPPEDPKSVAKANTLLGQDYARAKAVSESLGGIQDTETTIYQGGIRQRESDQSQANTRLNQALNTFNQAFGEITKLAPYAKSGATVVAALNATLAKAHAYAQQFGGLRDQPQVQPGANMTRSSDLFKPPAPLGAPTTPAAAPGAAPAPAPSSTPFVFNPPPTGAPRTSPATQGPYAPSAPPVIPVAPAPPMSEQVRDSTSPGYPGNPGIVGPQSVDSSPPPMPTPDGGQDPTITQMPLSDQAAQAQAMIGPPPPRAQGGTLQIGRDLGFDPQALAVFAAMMGQQEQPAA